MADEAVENAKEKARTLAQAADYLEELGEHSDEMMASGQLPQDGKAKMMQQSIQAASQTCKMVATSIVIALAQDGHTVDFDADEEDDESQDPWDGRGVA